jgi:NADH-quinone oxidoreductase subunit D
LAIFPGDAVSYGCTGPTARASGVSCDIRKLYPYEVYGQLEFEEVTATGGDCFARYMVRMQEMRQSLSIIEQLIDNIPEGEFLAKTKAVLKLPKGEFYSRVETARGEFGVYIISEGGDDALPDQIPESRVFQSLRAGPYGEGA